MHTRGIHGPSGHGRHQNPTGFGKKHGHYPTGLGWKNFPGPSGAKKFQKYWSFQTKHKVFMVTLSYDGGAVRICERTRLFGYEVTVTIDAADWIIDTLEEIQQKSGAQRVNLKRSFRNSVASCLMECYANNKGSFLKISVLKENKLKMIIVPEEEGAKGWLELKNCLSGVVKRQVTVSNDRSSSLREEQKAWEPTIIQSWTQQKAETNNGRTLNQRSWANVVKEPWKTTTKQNFQVENAKAKKFVSAKEVGRRKGDIEWRELFPAINPSFKPKNPYPEKRFHQPKFYEYMRSRAQIRNWELATILFRDNSHASWSVIFYNLSRELGRKLVCPFHPWSWESQKENIKVECRDSWIGIQGLPLNLWHMKIFRKIGDCCGGLLDVDKDTAEASMLSHMRLQLRGDDSGFVPEYVVLEHDDFDHNKVFGEGNEPAVEGKNGVNGVEVVEKVGDGRDEEEIVAAAVVLRFMEEKEQEKLLVCRRKKKASEGVNMRLDSMMDCPLEEIECITEL
ncbi:hypothetical protein F8388_014130 [Cannabis sativa]|uniref:DUF4283 domain-containing protein n=1 Tax=Cannabis sativa TaxID=3483 RepID=A0A7J6GMP4_CANSA|nr:hypothetical protein F8388_014130 [Cannabis sativa]